eukprot:Sdes_comp20627_c0_seq3m15765
MKRIEKTAQNSHPQQPLICEEFPVRKDSKKKSLSNFSVPEKNSSPKSNDANEEIFALLKSFDLNYKFGPCIGISRKKRWEIANRNGLNPPEKILEILEKHANA